MSIPQYINVNGKLRINPAYEQRQKTTVLNSNALTIVSTPNTFIENDFIREPKPLIDVIEKIQDVSYLNAFKVGSRIDPGEIVDELSEIFKRNKIPIGLMGHLIELRNSIYESRSIHIAYPDVCHENRPFHHKRQIGGH